MCQKNSCDKCYSKDHCLEFKLKSRAIKIDRELTEALSVIKFYAEQDNWDQPYHREDGDDYCMIVNDSGHTMGSCGCSPICQCPNVGGKKARELLKKITGE